jgi:hypothetical protein
VPAADWPPDGVKPDVCRVVPSPVACICTSLLLMSGPLRHCSDRRPFPPAAVGGSRQKNPGTRVKLGGRGRRAAAARNPTHPPRPIVGGRREPAAPIVRLRPARHGCAAPRTRQLRAPAPCGPCRAGRQCGTARAASAATMRRAAWRHRLPATRLEDRCVPPIHAPPCRRGLALVF